MWYLKKAISADYGGIASLLGTLAEMGRVSREEVNRCLESLPAWLEGGSVYCGKQGRNVTAFATIFHTLQEPYFPKGLSYREESELLEQSNVGSDEIVVIPYCLSLKQNGSEGEEGLLQAILGRYPHHSFLSLLPQDEEARIQTFRSCGFEYRGEVKIGKETRGLYCRKYRPSGLCREAYW